jgi:hypothetical protein
VGIPGDSPQLTSVSNRTLLQLAALALRTRECFGHSTCFGNWEELSDIFGTLRGRPASPAR